jgi:hypothetical protein
MASEVRINLSVQVVHDSFSYLFAPGQIAVDQAAVGRSGHVQSITSAAEEVVDFGDVVTEGYIVLRNLDAAHYVTYGPEQTGAMVVVGKLKPGEVALFRMAPTVVLRAQADTAPVKLQVDLFED